MGDRPHAGQAVRVLRQLVVDAVAPVVAECSATATKPSTDTPNKLVRLPPLGPR